MNGISATSSSPHTTDFYWLDLAGSAHHMSGDGTVWDNNGGEKIGGEFIMDLAAVAAEASSTLPAARDVFGVGSDFAMYRKSFDGTSWDASWTNLGGQFISAPGALERPDRMIDVFAVGVDYALYHRFFLYSKAGEWERLGGTFSSTASAVSFDLGRLDVFARGADFTLRHRTLSGFTWSSDWHNLGGSLASPPVAVSWGPDRLDVFAVGSDESLIHRWWDGDFWSEWESLGGSLTGTPSVVSCGQGRLDVYALGTDAGVYHYSWTDGAWTGRESLGGRFTAGPTAITPSLNQILLLAPGTGGDILPRKFAASYWEPGLDGVQIWIPTRYRFSVDYVHCTNPRSLHQDTDFAQASVGAGNWSVHTVLQSIGDIGGSNTAQTNLLDMEPVAVDLCEATVFNYLIVNNGHADQKTIDAALVKAGTSLTADSVTSISKGLAAGVGVIIGVELVGGLVAPVIGSLLGSLVDWLLGKVGDIVFADCDGAVAAEQLAITGRDLHLKTVSGPYNVTTTHNGTDSNTGCGANSQYEVIWSITRV